MTIPTPRMPSEPGAGTSNCALKTKVPFQLIVNRICGVSSKISERQFSASIFRHFEFVHILRTPINFEGRANVPDLRAFYKGNTHAPSVKNSILAQIPIDWFSTQQCGATAAAASSEQGAAQICSSSVQFFYIMQRSRHS